MGGDCGVARLFGWSFTGRQTAITRRNLGNRCNLALHSSLLPKQADTILNIWWHIYDILWVKAADTIPSFWAAASTGSWQRGVRCRWLAVDAGIVPDQAQKCPWQWPVSYIVYSIVLCYRGSGPFLGPSTALTFAGIPPSPGLANQLTARWFIGNLWTTTHRGLAWTYPIPYVECSISLGMRSPNISMIQTLWATSISAPIPFSTWKAFSSV